MHFTGSKFCYSTHLMTFTTISSHIKFLLILNFAVWDTIQGCRNQGARGGAPLLLLHPTGEECHIHISFYCTFS